MQDIRNNSSKNRRLFLIKDRLNSSELMWLNKTLLDPAPMRERMMIASVGIPMHRRQRWVGSSAGYRAAMPHRLYHRVRSLCSRSIRTKTQSIRCSRHVTTVPRPNNMDACRNQRITGKARGQPQFRSFIQANVTPVFTSEA